MKDLKKLLAKPQTTEQIFWLEDCVTKLTPLAEGLNPVTVDLMFEYFWLELEAIVYGGCGYEASVYNSGSAEDPLDLQKAMYHRGLWMLVKKLDLTAGLYCLLHLVDVLHDLCALGLGNMGGEYWSYSRPKHKEYQVMFGRVLDAEAFVDLTDAALVKAVDLPPNKFGQHWFNSATEWHTINTTRWTELIRQFQSRQY